MVQFVVVLEIVVYVLFRHGWKNMDKYFLCLLQLLIVCDGSIGVKALIKH